MNHIGDITFIITEEQRDRIAEYMTNGQKSFFIGASLIIVHQIAGIYNLDTYRRVMKDKLQEKDRRMCKRCGTIVQRADRCPCKEFPEKYPDILTVARQENPQLAKELDALASSKSFPALPDGQ